MRRPSQGSKDPEERRLAMLMGDYLIKYPWFRAEIDALCPPKAEQNKKRVIDWLEINKRKLSKSSKDPEERELAVVMYTYYYKDPEFRNTVDTLAPSPLNSQKNKELVMDTIELLGRRLNKKSSDPEERRLSRLMTSYYKDPKFVPYMSGKNEELIKLYAPYEVEGWSLVFIGERSFTVQREKPSVMSKFFHSLFKVIGYNR